MKLWRNWKTFEVVMGKARKPFLEVFGRANFKIRGKFCKNFPNSKHFFNTFLIFLQFFLELRTILPIVSLNFVRIFLKFFQNFLLKYPKFLKCLLNLRNQSLIFLNTQCAKNQFVTHHKRVLRRTTGLLSPEEMTFVCEVWLCCDRVRSW